MYVKVVPMLLVDDVDEAAAFYQEVFGAVLSHTLPETNPFEWVSLLFDDVEVMIWHIEAAQKECPAVSLAPAPNSITYVYVEDVDTLYERVREKVTVLMHPKDQPYGIREFTVQDRFGFIFTFAQIVS